MTTTDAAQPRATAPRRHWTLQTRLMATVLSIVSVLLILVAIVVSVVLRTTLDQQLSDRVKSTSDRTSGQIATAIFQGYTDPAQILAGVHAQPGTLLILPDPDGASYNGAVVGEESITTLDSAAVTSGIRDAVARLTTADRPQPRNTVDVHIDGGGSYRVTAIFIPNVQVSGLIGLSVSSVDEQVTILLWAVAIVTIGGLIILALATVLVIRSGLRPLREVVATAEQVAHLKLDEGRVAITDRVAQDSVDDHTEVGRVGAALNTMLDHVDASLQSRARNEELMRRFVADASHELRTPLASIRGYSELSLRSSENPETTTAALERIQAQSIRMTTLVEDLLLLARLDEGQELVVGEVDLTPLVIDAVSDARAAGRDHVWSVDVEGESVMVRGDAGRIAQVVTNLLANARTHTPEGTTVELGLHREDHDAVITVHDNGPGIDPAVRDELFERFSRADRSRARKTGGTGLGLSIARAIADAHHGSLSVASEPGDTTFTLRLPLVPVAGTNAAPPPSLAD
ncbi:sensor histidine kinase [Microbacterium sp. ZW T5_56]|uniref:sensor histidine kinase n=1 Tax=Microbacterium sp. ZW T5_56 TaxID=3378081 RepID=UPI003851DBDC